MTLRLSTLIAGPVLATGMAFAGCSPPEAEKPSQPTVPEAQPAPAPAVDASAPDARSAKAAAPPTVFSPSCTQASNASVACLSFTLVTPATTGWNTLSLKCKGGSPITTLTRAHDFMLPAGVQASQQVQNMAVCDMEITAPQNWTVTVERNYGSGWAKVPITPKPYGGASFTLPQPSSGPARLVKITLKPPCQHVRKGYCMDDIEAAPKRAQTKAF